MPANGTGRGLACRRVRRAHRPVATSAGLPSRLFVGAGHAREAAIAAMDRGVPPRLQTVLHGLTAAQ